MGLTQMELSIRSLTFKGKEKKKHKSVRLYFIYFFL